MKTGERTSIEDRKLISVESARNGITDVPGHDNQTHDKAI